MHGISNCVLGDAEPNNLLQVDESERFRLMRSIQPRILATHLVFVSCFEDVISERGWIRNSAIFGWLGLGNKWPGYESFYSVASGMSVFEIIMCLFMYLVKIAQADFSHSHSSMESSLLCLRNVELVTKRLAASCQLPEKLQTPRQASELRALHSMLIP
jgi:hypothetical protein